MAFYRNPGLSTETMFSRVDAGDLGGFNLIASRREQNMCLFSICLAILFFHTQKRREWRKVSIPARRVSDLLFTKRKRE